MPSDRLPPGNMGLPVIGQTPQFLFDGQFIEKQYQRYGSIFKTHLFGRPAVYMVGPQACEFLLARGAHHFSWREGWPDPFKILLGESLFVQDGEEHRRNRRLMMPAFHAQALARYVETMEAIALKYCQRWENQGELRWFDEMKQLTFDIASQLLVGADTGAQTERLSRLFTTLTNGLFSLFPLNLPLTKFGRAIAARDRLLEHIRQVVRDRQENPTNDALSLLIQARDEAGNRLSEDELTAQAMLLLFAGHETTTSMLAWLCLELARHPDILQRAREEQQPWRDRPSVDLEQLGQMPYLERLLAEVERKLGGTNEFHPAGNPIVLGVGSRC